MIIFLLIGFISLITLAQSEKLSTRLKSANCFFGIHFDLHASEDINISGKTLTTLQPVGKELDVDFQNGVSKVVVPELIIHSILEVIL